MSLSVNNCIIINLDSRPDLWESLEHFREHWKQLGKECARMQGVNYTTSKNVLNSFIINKRIDLTGVGFRKSKQSVLGELGCYVSHYNSWKYIVDNKIECCLIMEDGVELLRRDLENIKIDNSLDLLFVNAEMIQDSNKAFIGYGTQGYVVTNKGAQKLLELLYTLDAPIDMHIRRLCNQAKLVASTTKEPFIGRNNNRLSSIEGAETDNDLNAKQNFNSLINRLIINMLNANINLDEYI
jgi:GR25 family glycosyltransferase involved in LPS biosynthesis